MLLYADEVDKASLPLSSSLSMNSSFEYFKYLQVYLDVVFRCFLYAGLLRKDWQIWVLAVLGRFILYFHSAWYSVSIIKYSAAIISI
jgi:hypothetical protein